MQFSALRRTTTFRLTVLYGLLFALGTIALLGMVYVRSTGYLTHRVDGILHTEMDGLLRSPRAGLRARLKASPLCDAPRFGRSLGAGLRRAWAAWCAG